MKNKILLFCACISAQQLNAAENNITRTQGVDDQGHVFIEYYNPQIQTWARRTMIDDMRLFSDYKLENNEKKRQNDHESLIRYKQLEQAFAAQEAQP